VGSQAPPTNGRSGPFCYSAPASNCSSDNACTHHSGGNGCSINCLLQQNAAGNDPPLRFLHDNGYTGSNAFTVGDAIKWAGTGRMASVWVCEHVFGGSNEYCGDTAQGTDGPLKLLEVFAGSLAIAGVIVGSATCADAYLICARQAFGVLSGIAGFYGNGEVVSPTGVGAVDGGEAAQTAKEAAQKYAALLRAAKASGSFDKRLPTAVSAVVDRTTGRVVGLGYSGEMTGAPSELEGLLPSPSREPWAPWNCAEPAACSKAIASGSNLQNLTVVTVRTRTGEVFPPCDNCSAWLPGGR
jgi:hypothetical protein